MGRSEQRGNGRDRPQRGRRKPPQSETGAERRFLHERLKSGSRLAVELIDGSRATGVIRSFTEEAIELRTDDDPAMRLPKSKIRYIEEID